MSEENKTAYVVSTCGSDKSTLVSQGVSDE